jgi:hypothetical protein
MLTNEFFQFQKDPEYDYDDEESENLPQSDLDLSSIQEIKLDAIDFENGYLA